MKSYYEKKEKKEKRKKVKVNPHNVKMREKGFWDYFSIVN